MKRQENIKSSNIACKSLFESAWNLHQGTCKRQISGVGSGYGYIQAELCNNWANVGVWSCSAAFCVPVPVKSSLSISNYTLKHWMQEKIKASGGNKSENSKLFLHPQTVFLLAEKRVNNNCYPVVPLHFWAERAQDSGRTVSPFTCQDFFCCL